MTKSGSVSTLAIAGAFAMLATLSAGAQATRTWVSGVGDDVNPCSRTAPCKTFAGAISKTAVNGEINCLDPGGFGAVTITKSITIDCTAEFGSILNAGTSGVIINFDSMGADVQRTVRLRHLQINGANTGLNGVRIIGGTNSANSEVFIQDCLIEGQGGNPGRGIDDARSNGGELYVTNTTIRNNAATGIVVLPATGSVRLNAVIDNVQAHNNNYGIAVSNGARAIISRSVFSGNTSGGIYADGPTAASEVTVSSSVVSNNGNGIQKGPGTSTIRLSDVDVFFNTTGISGSTFSFGTNRIAGNTSAGTAPTAVGASSTANGQQ